MQSCLLRALAPSTFRVPCRSQVHLWWKALRRKNSTISTVGPELVDIYWKRLGVPASVSAALRTVFPHIAKPTKTQAQLIPAILPGKDVLLKDHTGTGKYIEFHVLVTSVTLLTNQPNCRSSGLILALLSDFRVWRSGHESHKSPTNPSVFSPVIVPHKDLTLQLARWIQVKRPELSISTVSCFKGVAG